MDAENYKQAVTDMYLSMAVLFEATDKFRSASYTVWNWDKKEKHSSSILQDMGVASHESAVTADQTQNLKKEIESLQRIIEQQKQRLESLDAYYAREKESFQKVKETILDLEQVSWRLLRNRERKESKEPPVFLDNNQLPNLEEITQLFKSFNTTNYVKCDFLEPKEANLDNLYSENLCGAMTEAEYQTMLKEQQLPSPIVVADYMLESDIEGYEYIPSLSLVNEKTSELPFQSQAPTLEGCDAESTGSLMPVLETPPEVILQLKPKRPDYNHKNWPSPRTKRFAKQIANRVEYSGSMMAKSIKTHQDALNYLAKNAKISVDTLLEMNDFQYKMAHAPWMLPSTIFRDF
jgi:hypothetical protein